MTNWFKLDNAAKIYPPIKNRFWAAMFRLSVDLSEDIDEEILKQAQENTLQRFPTFSCRLKAGLFWYYLDHIDGQPPILKDIYNPIGKLDLKANNHFLYRILIYKNRLAIEFFHSLTDGTGGTTFLLTLVNEYLHLRYGVDICPSKYILNVNQQPDPEEIEDSFLKYGNYKVLNLKEKHSYQVKSSAVPYNKMMIISGIVDTNQLKEVAKRYNTTVGIFSGALLLYSFYQIYKNDKRKLAKKKPIKISIPVNLRNYFPSKTLRNFTSFVNPGIYGQLGEVTIEECVEAVSHYLGLFMNEKQLGTKISYNVAAERNPFIRALPLLVKIPFLQFAYIFSGNIYFSSTISNLGNVTLPEQLVPYVNRIDFMLGKFLSCRSNCGVISYNGKTVFNFTRNRQQSDVEQYFFSTMVNLGIDVFIESNGGY